MRERARQLQKGLGAAASRIIRCDCRFDPCRAAPLLPTGPAFCVLAQGEALPQIATLARDLGATAS